MKEINNLNEIINNFPMYSNITLPIDIKIKLDDAYNSLLIYRNFNINTKNLIEDNEVFFIEDCKSLILYLSNILYKEGKKSKVYSNIKDAINDNITPKIFFIDMSAINNHKLFLELIDAYPNTKMILMSGISEYIHSFIKEMYYLRRGLKIDYIFNRNSDTILNKIKECS